MMQPALPHTPITSRHRGESEFERSSQVVRAPLHDIQLGDHPSEYGLEEKYAQPHARRQLNPFIDAATCKREVNLGEEAMFRAILIKSSRSG